MSDNLDQVAAFIKELLSLNRLKSAPMAHPPSADDQNNQRRVKNERVVLSLFQVL